MMPVKLCFVLLAALAAGALAPAMAAPHIVVIMADDLDVHTVEKMLELGLMPKLKMHVVDRGIRFTQSFVTNSLCCPSRSTYLSGRYSHNHGVLRNNAVRNVAPDSPRYGSVIAFNDGSTIATWLKLAKYRTGHVGKYLNGYGSSGAAPQTSPLNPRYVPPGWDHWQGLIDMTTYNVYNYSINDNGNRVEYGSAPEDYQTAVLAERASRFITDSLPLGGPLFLSVTPIAPHVEISSMAAVQADGYADSWRWTIRPDPRDETRKPEAWNTIFQLPLQPQQKPSFNEDDVSDKPSNLRRPRMTPEDIDYLTRQYRTRFASMLAVDDLVGSIVDALGSQLANTVIIFTSDNGYLYGEHRMAEKVVAYEESIRVPLYIADQRIAVRRNVDAIVLNNDLAPTIAQLAGVAPQAPVDGRSLVPLLLDQPPPADWRKRFLVEHWSSGDEFDTPTYAAIRTGPSDAYPKRLLVEHFGDPLGHRDMTALELYDLNTDEYQIASRHADQAQATKEEIAWLHFVLQLLRSCGASGALACAAAER
jgi:N-acetylglucosamine-6-sulfatase